MDAKESQLYFSLVIAVIVFAVIMFYFFYSMLRQHKKVRELERVNSKAQIEMLEKDRARIAGDLHDDLAPMLASISLNMEAMNVTNEFDRVRFEQTKETVKDIAKRMRSISFDLMPSALQQKGLQGAIQEFSNYVSKPNAPQIRFVAPKQSISLDEDTTIHIYRIVQEIVHNTIKHAKATELTILLSQEADRLELATSDNGIGFDHRAQLKRSTGLGLKSMMNRIYLLQAELFMDSQPGKGTSITIRIPQHHE